MWESCSLGFFRFDRDGITAICRSRLLQVLPEPVAIRRVLPTFGNGYTRSATDRIRTEDPAMALPSEESGSVLTHQLRFLASPIPSFLRIFHTAYGDTPSSLPGSFWLTTITLPRRTDDVRGAGVLYADARHGGGGSDQQDPRTGRDPSGGDAGAREGVGLGTATRPRVAGDDGTFFPLTVDEKRR